VEWDAAVAAQRTAIEHPTSYTLSRSQRGEVHRSLGRFLMGAGRLPEAETELRRSLALLRVHYGADDHPNVEETKRTMHQLYAGWGRPLDAERYRVPPARLLAPDWW
jgi:hypothetical protein